MNHFIAGETECVSILQWVQKVFTPLFAPSDEETSCQNQKEKSFLSSSIYTQYLSRTAQTQNLRNGWQINKNNSEKQDLKHHLNT